MALSDTQKRAFISKISEILKINTNPLKEVGVDVTVRIEKLDAGALEIDKTEAAQEQAQAASRKATAVAQQTLKPVYDDASAVVDLITGALGKKHPLVLEIKNMRDEMINEKARGKREKANI